MPAIRWPPSAPRKTRSYLHTDLLGDIGIVQRTSSVTQTAYAHPERPHAHQSTASRALARASGRTP